jgi:hypothetical protein
MSNDTHLSLRECKDKKGRFYVLRLCTSEGEVIERIDTYTNLRTAMIAAEAYSRENNVEYGLAFFPITDGHPPGPLSHGTESTADSRTETYAYIVSAHRFG